MRNFTTVICILAYTGCAITACSTYPTHAYAITNEQMDLDTMEIENIERDKRMQRMDDELQRIRDQLYYMRTMPSAPNTVPGIPCGNCAFR